MPAVTSELDVIWMNVEHVKPVKSLVGVKLVTSSRGLLYEQ